jgi:hypothetical protein
MTVAVTRYESELIDAITDRLHDRVRALIEAGGDPARLGSPEELANRMLAAVPWAHPWDEQIGPFYDTAGLTRYLGVSKQALADRVARRRLLAVSVDGRVLYPARQFEGRQLIPGLADTLTEFRDVPVDGWVIAAWLTTPAAALDDTTPLAWLKERRPVVAARALAAAHAARWKAP